MPKTAIIHSVKFLMVKLKAKYFHLIMYYIFVGYNKTEGARMRSM